MTAATPSPIEVFGRKLQTRFQPVAARWSAFSQTRTGGLIARAFGVNATWMLMLLIALMIFFNVAGNGKFITQFNLTVMAVNVSVLLILAIGETFVMGTGGIDLSVGYVTLFAGVTSAQAMNWGGQNPTNAGWGLVAVGLVVALFSGLLWGVINGVLVAKAKVPSLIATLGTFGMAWGFAEILSNGQDIRYLPSIMGDLGGDKVLDVVPYVVVVAFVLAILGMVVLSMTRFGRYTLAIGSNQEAARRAGINVDRHLIKVYALSGLMAGVAGFLDLCIFTTTTISGHANENLQAIAGVVIGGTSLVGGVATVFGSTVGVFIEMVLFSGFTIVGYQSFWRDVAVGAVLIIAVYADQLRRRRRERR